MRKIWRIVLVVLVVAMLFLGFSLHEKIQQLFEKTPVGFLCLYLISLASFLWAGVIYIFERTEIGFISLFDGHADDTGRMDLETISTADGNDYSSSPSLLNWSLFGATNNDSGSGELESLEISRSVVTALFFAFSILSITITSVIMYKIAEALSLNVLKKVALAAGYIACSGIMFLPLSPALKYSRFLVINSLKRSFAVSKLTLLPLGSQFKVQFLDVIICDVLTSFSQPLADAGLVTLHLVVFSNTPTLDVAVGAFISSIPYAVRLKQCATEAWQIHVKDAKSPSPNRVDSPVHIRNRHLANACKYSTAFPVIILAALVAINRSGPHFAPLVYSWVAASVINSLYSLVWDVRVDWLLGDIGPRSFSAFLPNNQAHYVNIEARRKFAETDTGVKVSYPFLRKRLWFYNYPVVYYIAIFVDIFARFSWVLKISATWALVGTNSAAAAESVQMLNVILKIVEISRRMMWCIFRIEREWLLQKRSLSPFTLPKAQTRFPVEIATISRNRGSRLSSSSSSSSSASPSPSSPISS